MSSGGRGAVVTGGGSGIGRATAYRFAAHDAKLAALDVDGDAAAADRFGGIAYPDNDAGAAPLIRSTGRRAAARS
jgi:NAD(P)-dependent dehydrogenase (short-subunit alcohol dehydrogenase family)